MEDEFIIFALGVFFIGMMFSFLYFYKKWRKGSVTYEESDDEFDGDYIPGNSGRNTGQKRLFQTNKGLRAYYVNEKGFPLHRDTNESD